MKNISDITENEIVNELLTNKLGILLLKTTDKNFYNILSRYNSNYNNCTSTQNVCANENYVTYLLYPLLYSIEIDDFTNEQTQKIVFIRNKAIYDIFLRWTNAGYNKHHAKDPYNCKKFMNYLNNIKFNKADYVLIKINDYKVSEQEKTLIKLHDLGFSIDSEQDFLIPIPDSLTDNHFPLTLVNSLTDEKITVNSWNELEDILTYKMSS